MTLEPHDPVRYDQRLAGSYDAGRGLAPQTERLWMEAVRRHAPTPLTCMLDLGSGTGRFARPFARHLGIEVLGVEPSEAMRTVAASEPGLRYLAGSASAIPLADESCDLAWMSMVAHHLPDLAPAARELRRVVRPGGVVMVRNCFRGRFDSCCFHEFFPAARVADEARHPSIAELRTAFEAAGLRWRGLDVVTQVLDETFEAYVERIAQRSVSSLEFLSEQEIDAGMATMRAAIPTRPPGPVTQDIDLLVFDRA